MVQKWIVLLFHSDSLTPQFLTFLKKLLSKSVLMTKLKLRIVMWMMVTMSIAIMVIPVCCCNFCVMLRLFFFFRPLKIPSNSSTTSQLSSFADDVGGDDDDVEEEEWRGAKKKRKSRNGLELFVVSVDSRLRAKDTTKLSTPSREQLLQ